MKALLVIAIGLLTLGGVSAEASNVFSELQVQAEMTEVHCYVSGQNIRIQNACGKMMEVYSVTGARVAQVRVDSEDKTVSLNLPKGIYIVKVGDFVRKIPLR